LRQLILALALTGTVWPQVANLRAAPPSDATPAVEPGDHLQDFNASLLPSLPPTIPGKATQMGGTIRKIDPVRDRLELKVFGGRDFTVLFDGRTKLYRNGELSATRTLKAGESASIETVLDGKDVFAKSIHILSHAISGESHGQIVSYDPTKGELVVRDSLSTQAVRMQVPPDAVIVREGQMASTAAQLAPGALVAISFDPQNGKAVARHISILATPGSVFVFSGTVSFLDLHLGKLSIVDPRDGQRYEVSFDPQKFALNHDLHTGSAVMVTASFDGSNYMASSINVTSASANPPVDNQ
jgi:hypothetical protein